jgi:hypothetical protein
MIVLCVFHLNGDYRYTCSFNKMVDYIPELHIVPCQYEITGGVTNENWWDEYPAYQVLSETVETQKSHNGSIIDKYDDFGIWL